MLLEVDVEKLVEEIRKCPVLYDRSHEKYRHAEYKENVWKKIAATLTAKGGIDECRKKWASVRDQFRRTVLKRKVGLPGSQFRRYKYESILEFLLPHLVETDTNTNVANSEENQEKDDEMEFFETHEELIKPTFSISDDISEESETESQNHLKESVDDSFRSAKSSSAGKASDSEKKEKFIRPMSLKRKISHETKQEPSPSGPIVSYVYSANDMVERKPSVDESGKHHVDAFLFGIAPTLKTLNPILLNQAKSRIFSIVQEYEMKQLMSGQYQVTTSFISTPCSDNSGQNDSVIG